MKLVLATALLLAAAPAFAQNSETLADTVIAAAQDSYGVTLMLTDSVVGDPGPCEGKAAALSLPPNGNMQEAVVGCWSPDPAAHKIHVTYVLGDQTPWAESYPSHDFTLTPYGHKLWTYYNKEM